MVEESREPGRWWESQPLAVAPRSNGAPAVQRGPEAADGGDAYALALEVFERLFLDQQARIAAEMEAARAAAEESDYKDYKSISHAAARAARVSWEADGQIAGLKQRLDELYQARVVEPIMEVRRLSSKMEEHNRNLFRRRVGDRR